jgi:acetoacetyl-CoA reductase/3-oxoacyl-[acyl-carrier protein] reductase
MRAGGGGSIVLVSSINALRGRFGQANYTSSKAGLIALAKTAAHETGRFGIRVNVVAPGLTETAMSVTMPDDLRKEEIEESPLKAIGQPEDVASAVLFLASSMSRHITGQTLRVDGGQLMA